MLLNLPIVWIVVLNVLGCPALQLGLAWAYTRMPTEWFSAVPSGQAGGGGEWMYERLFAIRDWKDRLPDGARWFSGGFAKGHLGGKDAAYLARFIRETRRGEACHWTALAGVPLFFIWNPWWGSLVIAAYAVFANVPCILVQRYNRIRLSRLLALAARRQRNQSI